jgi:glycine cleavage system H lipoate-binding protein
MPYQVLPTDVAPCVWMRAGVLRYRLCDRDFDCASCPLDAVLRGGAGSLHNGAQSAAARLPLDTPGDRLYAGGHTWVQPRLGRRKGLCRVGVDAFAAALIGGVSSVRWQIPTGVLRRGDPLCEIDLGVGVLRLRTPIGGRLVGCNHSLEQHPEWLVAEPFGSGWIGEVAGVDPVALMPLWGPESARSRTDVDLTEFRHEVARRLLSDPIWEDAPAGDGRPLTDLRRVFGGAGYMELLSRFIP